MKIVLDTNVIISSLLWKGTTREIFNLSKQNGFEIITSRQILSELFRVCSYPKFQIYLKELQLSPQQIVDRYLTETKIIEDVFVFHDNALDSDPSDRIILSCAISAQADYIVSGDKHLLNLKTFYGIPILTPRQFLNLFK